MNQIIENLYLGDHTAAHSREMLKRVGITHILNITESVENKFTSMCEYMHIHLPDIVSADLYTHFPEIIKFIHNGMTQGKVLVHCYAGVSRSATAVLAFLIYSHDMNLSDAFKFVKGRRFILPNDGFCA